MLLNEGLPSYCCSHWQQGGCILSTVIIEVVLLYYYYIDCIKIVIICQFPKEFNVLILLLLFRSVMCITCNVILMLVLGLWVYYDLIESV